MPSWLKISLVMIICAASLMTGFIIGQSRQVFQYGETGQLIKNVQPELSELSWRFHFGQLFSNQRHQLVEKHSYNNEVVILTFHDISSTDKSLYAITPPMFESDIKDILKNGYHIITLQQAINYSQNKGTVPPNAVVITSDDGYVGMYNYVYPVLKKYKIPATFFLVAGVVGKKPNFLSWAEVKVMQASGLVTFGGHTYNSHNEVLVGPKVLEPATIAHIYNPNTHHTETAAEFFKRMSTDSTRAQEIFIKQLGHPTPLFAYPYGAYTPELDRALLAARYRYFFTEIPGALNRKHHTSQFFRLDIGMPTITPTQMINQIQQWSETVNPNNNIPSKFIIRWKLHF